MLHTPRLSLVPLGAEHFEPLAAMYADPEVIRFVEPAPLDRGEGWRRLAMHVGHRLLLPPGILGTWIRVGSGGRVCAVRVRRVAPAVVSLVHPDNVRSQRVAERGGAKVEREMVLRGLPARVFLWPQH